DVVRSALTSTDPVVRKEALIALGRAGTLAAAPASAGLLDDSDPIVAHTAVQVLRQLRAVDAPLAVVDAPPARAEARRGALQVLQSIHDLAVVDALASRLQRATDATRRRVLVAALSRLANREAPWNGTWWATRSSTVGPYYEPEAWEGTPAV